MAATCKGAALEGLLLQHPFYDRVVPVICGEHVTLEAGTGLVHTAPAHGLDDYFVGQKYNLPTDNPVGDDGKFVRRSAAGRRHVRVESQRCGDCRTASQRASAASWKRCSTAIRIAGGTRPRSSSVPRRSGSSAWIMWRHPAEDAEQLVQAKRSHSAKSEKQEGVTLRDLANKAVEQTEFFPGWGRARLEAMIRNRPDWCVSRQRSWGVPMPFFVHKETGAVAPAHAGIAGAGGQAGRARRHRGLVQPELGGLAGRRGRPLQKTQRHAGCVVRFRRHPCCAVLASDSQQTGDCDVAGRPVSGRLGPASRLVPVQLADRLRHQWPRALRCLAHARLRRGRQRPQDVEIQGQRDRAAERFSTRWGRISCACGWLLPTTPAR